MERAMGLMWTLNEMTLSTIPFLDGRSSELNKGKLQISMILSAILIIHLPLLGLFLSSSQSWSQSSTLKIKMNFLKKKSRQQNKNCVGEDMHV